MKIDRFVAQFSFLGNGELIPNANEVEVVRISRISYELLAIRPRVESENGNLVDCLHEDRVWLLARDGNVLAEVKYQEEKIVHGVHGSPWQHQGESVGDTVRRVGPDVVHFALRVERGHEWRHGNQDPQEPLYTVTVYKAARFSLSDREARKR